MVITEQPRDIVSPACPVSSLSLLPDESCLGHLPREVSIEHTKQVPKPPQLTLLNAKEVLRQGS